MTACVLQMQMCFLLPTGEEKDKLLARQKSSRPTPLAKTEEAALDRLRSDLNDSSDEEEARNPMEQASLKKSFETRSTP